MWALAHVPSYLETASRWNCSARAAKSGVLEADAPRSVLFGPCNHYLACASCAAALAECPNCRATITTRTTIANSS